MEVSGRPHALTILSPRAVEPGTHWRGGWVGPRESFEEQKNFLRLLGIEPRFLSRRAIISRHTDWAVLISELNFKHEKLL
jgi:hypothetical protein